MMTALQSSQNTMYKSFKKDQIIIKGRRSDNGLWNIPLNGVMTPASSSPKLVDNDFPTSKDHVSNGVIILDKSELADYYAATLFNPIKSTLLRAIRNNHLTSWSALTTKLVSKHLSKRLASV